MHTPTLHTEFLSGPRDAETLTLIHGWGAESSVWKEWAQSLSNTFNVCLVDLPGFGLSPACKEDPELECWVTALLSTLPAQSHVLGWSLGGLIAQTLVLRQPERFHSLICLASTPRFTQCDGWNWAVSPPLMADFIRMLGIEYKGVLKRFWSLQVQGSPNAKSLLRELKSHMQDRHLPKFEGLIQGLHLLRDLDIRDRLHTIHIPTLWLFGDQDPLIPVTMRDTLTAYQPDAHQTVLKGAGHLPFFSHPGETRHAVVTFIQTYAVANECKPS